MYETDSAQVVKAVLSIGFIIGRHYPHPHIIVGTSPIFLWKWRGRRGITKEPQ